MKTKEITIWEPPLASLHFKLRGDIEAGRVVEGSKEYRDRKTHADLEHQAYLKSLLKKLPKGKLPEGL